MSIVWLRACLALCCLLSLCDAAFQAPLGHRDETSALSFSTSWHVLGPFQIGTREATWGADPLEYIGGFRQLQYDPDARFRSPLPVNGTAAWHTTTATQVATSPSSANATLSISYSNVDWDFLKVVYGWAAVQYQAWARGQITVNSNSTAPVVFYTDTVLEFWIDHVQYFGGDMYTYRTAAPVVHLTPGHHTIDLRLVRDVRAFGGILEPTVDIVMYAEQTSGTLELAKPGVLMSDVVDDSLATPIGSVTLRNSGVDDIEVLDIQSSDVRHPISLQNSFSQHVLAVTSPPLTIDQSQHAPSNTSLGILVVAGQTRPVAFNVSLPTHNVSTITYSIIYKSVNAKRSEVLTLSQNLTKTSVYEPHKIVYIHPGGMASYAMLRPPARNASCRSGRSASLPVLLQLHGAGLEADNGMVAHALDSVPDLCSWVMFPTGVTPWSGDDWHNWGFADVEAAVNTIPDWIKNVKWKGPDVDINRWLVSGHSNGGQGTWWALTHRPDKILAAAPVSGYASIQKYVPYELWQPADPQRIAVISASLNSHRHEMLMPNAHGIPIQQQHGEIDDNVPAYNSRLLAQQLYLSGTNSSYNEVAGQNHWWDTVMTTSQLVDFYYKQTNSNDTIPRKLDTFDFVVGDPSNMGSKGGLRVLLLEDPGLYGKVHVKGHTITTSNVLSLEFDPIVFGAGEFSVDGQNLDLSSPSAGITTQSSVVVTQVGGKWSNPELSVTKTYTTKQRTGRQLGSMTAILHTQGAFTIRHQGLNITSHLALQVSRNLCQYFQADTDIIRSSSWKNTSNGSGNIITVVIADNIPSNIHNDFPIGVGSSGVTVRNGKGVLRHYSSADASLGAAFLRPLENERLELVLWGSNAGGLSQASRLVPMLTGVGQPDFVVFDETASWKGVEGALAMGFFDHEWEITSSSVVS